MFNTVVGVRCISFFTPDLYNTTEACVMYNIHSMLCYREQNVSIKYVETKFSEVQLVTDGNLGMIKKKKRSNFS